MLESKITEKCYRILELKFNLGQKDFCKFYLNFTKLDKIPKISCIDQFMVVSLSIYLNKGKIGKAFLSNIHMLHYDCCKGFLRP